MSITKLVATVSLGVAVLTMVTSIQLPVYASPTTEAPHLLPISLPV